jgi:hypothetical protein
MQFLGRRILAAKRAWKNLSSPYLDLAEEKASI